MKLRFLSALLAALLLLSGCTPSVTIDGITVEAPVNVEAPASAPVLPSFTIASPETGDTKFTNVLASGYIEAGGELLLTKQPTVTVGTDGVITPLGVYTPITASAARGVGSITGGEAGELLILVNGGTNTITISDTTGIRLSGDIALGQNDSLTLLHDGYGWIQVATSNN